MAGSDLPHDPHKALEFKKRGNDHFQTGNYEAAEQSYSKALVYLLDLLPLSAALPIPHLPRSTTPILN